MRRKVKRVIDGDTFVTCRRIGNTNRVRLANVNAPAKKQFGGRKATNRLKGMVGGKTVTITPRGRSYGRVVADVRVNRRSVNKRMRR